MPMPFFEMPSDYDPRERRDEDMKCGGVAEPRWFNITVTFQTLADAMASKAGFEEAGYKFELLDEIDEYSNAAFVTISRPAGSVSMDELFQQARAVADELKGDADGAWISPKINHDYDAS